jgi:hypothetical protein
VPFIFYVTYMKSMRPLFQVSRYAPSYSSNTNWLASSFCLSSKEQIDGMRFLLSCEDYSSLGIGHPNNVGKTYYYYLPMELFMNFYCWTKIKYLFTFLDFTIKFIKNYMVLYTMCRALITGSICPYGHKRISYGYKFISNFLYECW